MGTVAENSRTVCDLIMYHIRQFFHLQVFPSHGQLNACLIFTNNKCLDWAEDCFVTSIIEGKTLNFLDNEINLH